MANFFSDLVANIVSHPVGQALSTVIDKAWDSMSAGDKRYIRFKATGNMPLEDENIVLQARAELRSDEPNYDRELNRKLAMLDPHMQDYYRLCVVGYPDADPAKSKADDIRYRVDIAKTIMKRHADLTDPEWAQEIVIMNLNQKKADTIVELIGNNLNKVKNGYTNLVNGIDAELKATGLPTALESVNKKLLASIQSKL